MKLNELERFILLEANKDTDKKGAVTIVIPSAASGGRQADRTEHYLIIGILENKLGGIVAEQDFELVFAGKPADPEEYVSKAVKIGLNIGKNWNGPAVTRDNTKVLGRTTGKLSPAYASSGAQPTSVTDVIIGGVKCSVKKSEASQVTLMEPGNYPLVFDYCYKKYRDAGGKIDLSKEIDGIVPADFQKKMIDTVLRDYAQAFTAEESGGKEGKGKKRGNILNAIFSFKQEKNVSLEAQKDLVGEILETYADAPELEKVFANLVNLYQSVFQDVEFKKMVVRELLTGEGKFVQGSSAVPTHMLFFSINGGKFKITPIDDKYLSENLSSYRWGARGGKGNVYKMVNKVKTFSKKRFGAIRVDQVDITDKLANQINLEEENLSAINEDVIDFLIQENILSKAKEGAISLAKKALSIIPEPLIKKAKEVFKKLVSGIVDIANNTFRFILSALEKDPVRAFEEDILEFDNLEFAPKEPPLDNKVDIDSVNESLTKSKITYKMLEQMVEEAIKKAR